MYQKILHPVIHTQALGISGMYPVIFNLCDYQMYVCRAIIDAEHVPVHYIRIALYAQWTVTDGVYCTAQRANFTAQEDNTQQVQV